MSKAVLLIGGVTHIKKEWSDCASVAQLLVCDCILVFSEGFYKLN